MASVASLAAPPGILLKVERAEDLVAGRGALQRLLTQLFTMFGCAALGLAGIGTYSLMAMTARQLRRMVAIRLALGAAPRTMVLWLLRRHIGPASIGVVLGLLLTGLATTVAVKTGVLAADRAKLLTVFLPAVATVAALIMVSLIPVRTAVSRPVMETLRQD
jgi:ABC-type antimicrobial peptide transport system permease subunit